MTPHQNGLIDLTRLEANVKVTIADGRNFFDEGAGTLKLIGVEGIRISVMEKLLIPGLDRRLLSAGKFAERGADQYVYVEKGKEGFVLDLGMVKVILGMEIDHVRSASTLMIKQTRYISDVAERFEQTNAKDVDNLSQVIKKTDEQLDEFGHPKANTASVLVAATCSKFSMKQAEGGTWQSPNHSWH
ncbi:TRANSPOSON TY4-H GAG POLYPROTEIN-RELATED [Plasmopara halstedii]|uniref:TRANSPOSON TY4-H GAG POLYPROTEIN-RELATED n=1 Tax=Plasmopara halstedii TaxID=4781 RepID=A0A0N7L492_PLAHL|nr:TRANSPOSON TY4-H GAG POLYPROTEIN-RELATED [Plasmopara halstedii]CEG38027.1 TRANSPOSON TY4-H GAG POLYPROTEIN-RELATED [Plasmopara halstedii]|eukprot:XP_024574396.1 TRANSPOSON TY4-H GAG POLYPROTEIN-RELATED [Plasmopara halstedii]